MHIPTWRFRQEPGGVMQISPLPCSCMGKRQQGAERAVQPLLAASTHCGTHTASPVFKGPVPTKGQSLLMEGSILLLSSQQKCTGLGLATGADGCLTHPLQCLDFKETGGVGEKKRKRVSGVHIVSEHPRQFSLGRCC